MSARQLPLDLPVRPALGREDFFVSDANAGAVAKLDAWRSWPNGKLALVGPPGSGKTHLAHVWADAADAEVHAATKSTDLNPGTLSTPLALDGMDVALTDAAETAIFHLHNALAAARLPLLMTGREAPSRWPIRLPDLKSRVMASDVAFIDGPDDALLSAVLLKHFADRQLVVPPQVVDYLLKHMERSFDAVRELASRLDKAALAEGRAVTRRLAARVLDEDAP